MTPATQAPTLAEFLSARLDEDEAAARAATARGGVWMQQRRPNHHLVRTGSSLVASATNETSTHIARHDPARVLADVAARRAVLAMHRQDRDAPWCMEGCGMRDGRTEWPCPTLRLLASVYADHPGFDERWRP